MNKFLQISLAIVVTFTFLLGMFQLTSDAWINVGWNGGISTTSSRNVQVADCTLCGLKVDREVMPYVGWNSGI